MQANDREAKSVTLPSRNCNHRPKLGGARRGVDMAASVGERLMMPSTSDIAV
jgi:hypothetical protein